MQNLSDLWLLARDSNLGLPTNRRFDYSKIVLYVLIESSSKNELNFRAKQGRNSSGFIVIDVLTKKEYTVKNILVGIVYGKETARWK